MWLLMLPLIVQTPTAQRPSAVPSPRQILEAEHARAMDVSVLMQAARSNVTDLQVRAVRALGRFERATLRDSIAFLVRSPAPAVRREAINAIGQLGASYDFAALLPKEPRGDVRGTIFETMGRSAAALGRVEQSLVGGLVDVSPPAREGAARGLESLLRRTARTSKPAATTLTALHQAMRANPGEQIRQLLVLAMAAAGDRDSATLAIAMRDPSAQVRRLAVAGARTWIEDTNPMVRYQALRAAGSCAQAAAAMRDRSEHVALAAIDVLAERNCDASTYAPVLQMALTDGTTWRMRAHALVALARIAPTLAQPALAASANARVWQERTYAAAAAKILRDSATLSKLARDSAPNVAIAAMHSADDAIRALTSEHSGLLLAAAAQLKGSSELTRAAPALRAAAQRLNAANRSTQRDPLVAISERLRELGDNMVPPVVAAYPVQPLPDEATIRSLPGTMVRIRMRGLGVFTLQILPDDAPLTAATFVQLAESGRLNGLTFHRIVSNFVIQGGSPGADEYDGVSAGFMRDEVGLTRHARGTLGISTRGRDTGDGQIFVNLVDNFRLDHEYSVFARVVSGMDIVDRVQEGDVMQSVELVRRATPRR